MTDAAIVVGAGDWEGEGAVKGAEAAGIVGECAGQSFRVCTKFPAGGDVGREIQP